MLIECNDRKPHDTRSVTPEFDARGASSNFNVVALDFARVLGRAESVTRRAAAEPAFQIAKSSGLERHRRRTFLAAAIAISVALHGGVIASMVVGLSGEEFGTLAERTNTFSLSTEQSVVLESISTESVRTASGAAAASQAGSVQVTESKPQELAELQNDVVSDEPPPKPIDIADVAPTDDPLPVIRGGGTPDAAIEKKADEISEAPVEEMPESIETKEDSPAKAERKDEVDKKKKTPQQQSHRQMVESSTSRANAAQAAVNGRVSASRGSALKYGAMVRAQLARNKPDGNGLRGTVRVSFGIAPDGGIRYLRLSKSSGSATLDDAALAVVRKSAPFGEPPPDLMPGQLAYVIPFYFR